MTSTLRKFFEPELRETENVGMEKGIEKGIQKGMEKGQNLLILKAFRKGKSYEELAVLFDMKIEEIETIVKEK